MSDKFAISLYNILNKSFFQLFGNIDMGEKQAIISQLTTTTVNIGEYLFSEGDKPEHLYVLLSGKMEAVITQDGIETRIGLIHRSETIGEMGLLTDNTRSASVKAIRKSKLAKLSKADFMDICLANPKLSLNIAKIISKRLSNSISNINIQDIHSNIGVISADKNITQYLAQNFINEHLSQKNSFLIDKTKLYSSFDTSFETLSQKKKELEIEEYFSLLEMNHDRILVNLEGMSIDIISKLSPFLDLIFVFKDSKKLNHLNEWETNFYQKKEIHTSKIWHVIAHPSHTKTPSGTKAFLEQRRGINHTHIRHKHPKEIERLLRLSTNKAIGLVLGGGGAKGLAHIGAIQGLEENNVPIDYIGGTSMGAIIAGLYAIYADAQSANKTAEIIFSNSPTPISDLNLIPKHSLYKGKKIENLLNQVLQNIDFEDLWIPFFCISTNITNPSIKIHEKGNLKDSIKASMSVPGLFPPVQIHGEYFVDGGLFNNIPVDVMLKKNIGKLIAIRVDKHEEGTTQNKILGPPSLTSTFMKSTLANSESHINKFEKYVDFFLEPPVGKFGFLNWKNFSTLVKIGYQHCIEKIKKENFLKNMNL